MHSYMTVCPDQFSQMWSQGHQTTESQVQACPRMLMIMARPETAWLLSLPDVPIGHNRRSVSNPSELPHLWTQGSVLHLADLWRCLQPLVTRKMCARADFHPPHRSMVRASIYLSQKTTLVHLKPSLFYGFGDPSFSEEEKGHLCFI